MSPAEVALITRQAIYTVIITATPVLLVSLIVGLIVSIFQTITSIQEQTLTFIPKILSIFIAIMILGEWMMRNMTTLMTNLWADFAVYVR
ncbi:MAG: flagellar biosynthesis protein FliQ [Lachnospiraceae bacterium]|jgi:flagellar biosynthetic protein FliQ|nr:flagellar biosynthesis protein FliQ [Lachnospiraceae bacterium]